MFFYMASDEKMDAIPRRAGEPFSMALRSDNATLVLGLARESSPAQGRVAG